MYKQKRNPFNSPIVKVDMEDGVLGKANKDGTIHINKDVVDPKQIKDIVKHESVHIDQMQRGDLDYNDNKVIWKGKEYSRAKMNEGAKNLPWEKEAYKKAGDSPLNKTDYGKKPKSKKNKNKSFSKRKYTKGPNLIDKIKNITPTKSKKTTSKKPSSTLPSNKPELEKQETQVPKIQATVNKNASKASTVLPTATVTPPPRRSMSSSDFTYDNTTGKRTYNVASTGNIISGQLRGGNVQTENYLNNNKTRNIQGQTNLSQVGDALWKQYEKDYGPNVGGYKNIFDFKRDLNKDVANYQEQRDVAATSYDYFNDLAQVPGNPNMRQFTTDSGSQYQVQWQSQDDKNPVAGYQYSQVDPTTGEFSKFFNPSDAQFSSKSRSEITNTRNRMFEDQWKNSQENNDFNNKWGGSRNSTPSSEGTGIGYDPNMESWYGKGSNAMNNFRGRFYQNDAPTDGSSTFRVGNKAYRSNSDRVG
jgi:hypothetical protein